MGDVDAFVDYADDDVAASLSNIPRLRRGNFRHAVE